MLPPGIFLWESGYEGVVEPADIESVASASHQWAEEVSRCGSWEIAREYEGVGRFVQASVECDSTVVIVRNTATTMEAARILVEKEILGEWGAVLAVEQAQGRGQLRRPWVSPVGNLHVSTVLPAVPSEGEWSNVISSLLPLVCGYVFSECFREMGADVKIKWPNDLLQLDRKVGGLLIESKGGVDILGFGLNLSEYPPDDKMREDHSVSAGILRANDSMLSPLSLWETLVNRGKNVYQVLLGELSPSQFISAITNRLAWLSHRVTVREGTGDSYYAELIGISQDGGIILRRPGGEVVLHSGSITPL